MSMLNIVKVASMMLALSTVIACSPEAKEQGVEITKPQMTFVEGKDYEVVRAKASTKPEITEHFSLYCGHCYKTEPLLKSLKESLAKEVAFKRSHVQFLPQKRPQWGQAMTFAVATANQLNVEDEFIAAVFDSHFKQELWLGNYEDLEKVFGELGIDANAFKVAINSPETLKLAQSMVNKAVADKVRFTPDLIVNDKYRVLLSDMNNTSKERGLSVEENLNTLVDYLLTNPK